nr:hypothetical protein [Chromobacterium violaceum]
MIFTCPGTGCASALTLTTLTCCCAARTPTKRAQSSKPTTPSIATPDSPSALNCSAAMGRPWLLAVCCSSGISSLAGRGVCAGWRLSLAASSASAPTAPSSACSRATEARLRCSDLSAGSHTAR